MSLTTKFIKMCVMKLIYANRPRIPFLFAIAFFWLAVHAVFTNIQHRALLGSESEISWGYAWTIFSPWFLNWIWITPIIYASIKSNFKEHMSLRRVFVRQTVMMIILLALYWGNAVFFRTLIMSPDLGFYFENLKNVSFQLDILIYLSVLFSCLGINFYKSRLEEKLEIKQLQTALLNEQLKTLRSQLNPHFLFNALNTVASLVRLKREKEAITALSELSHMLRKILENKNNADIKVKDEIAFISSYLSIQKMRFAEKLDAHVSVEEDCMEISIPNMLLHPLVENAVQHGSQLESNKNLLNLEVRRSNGELKIKLTNKVAINDQHKGFGIGLSHTQARLSKLYSNFQLELNPLDDDLFETLLAIPIGEQDAEYTHS